MIVKRLWIKTKGKGREYREWKRAGWFLFGIIPLYIKDLSYKEAE